MASLFLVYREYKIDEIVYLVVWGRKQKYKPSFYNNLPLKLSLLLTLLLTYSPYCAIINYKTKGTDYERTY